MKFLGLRLDEHDSNITFTDGEKVKYYKPERHNQIKHFGYDNLFDWYYACNHLDFKLSELNAVAIVIDLFKHPYLKRKNPKDLYETIDIPYKPFTDLKCPVFIIDHHYAHSLSSWMLTDEQNIDFVLDGFGDYYRSTSVFKNNKLKKTFTLDEMVSLGQFLGQLGQEMQVQGHTEDKAGKLMALKEFGQIDKTLLENFLKFDYTKNKEVLNIENYIKLYGSKLASKHSLINYLKTIHEYSEIKIPEFFKEYSNKKDTITYSGGVAHNVCINTQLKKNFPNLIIPPHCSDEGLSLGCVEFLRKHYNQIKFNTHNFPFWQTDKAPEKDPSKKTIKKIAEELANGKIIGWYQGQGELGPRSLGNRSILMSPEVKDGKHILNSKVKHREDYRPFAASIKLDQTKKYFDWEGESEFMKYSVKFKDKIFAPISHIDGTSRIQTVKSQHTYFYNLIDEFENITGIPMLLNTSLNDNGKPIAGSPNDAINLLKNSNLDILVVGDNIYNK
jgi:carbamoyltransferase